MKGLYSVLLALFLAFAVENNLPPLPQEDDEEIIAVYECKEGYLQLVWYHPELTEEQVRKLKEGGKVKCKNPKEKNSQ